MALPSVSNTNNEGLELSAQTQNHDGAVANAKDEKKTKRTKSPGVRLVGNRIYDSTNGITCHQCRQKTRSFAASCKNQRNGKPCVIKYCQKCLKNRYGEIAEEVELLNDWICPKCRGFCNCSCCMKKRGESPTGPMAHTAKASGFKSVSEMLSVNSEGKMKESALKKDSRITGVDKPSCGKVNMNNAVSHELVIVLSGESGKENSVDGSSGLKLDSLKAHKASPKKSRKSKREGLKEISNGKNSGDSSQERSPKRPKVCDEAQEAETKGNANDGIRACKEVPVNKTEPKEATTVNGVSGDVKSQAATTVFHGVSKQEMKVGRSDEINPVPMDGPEVWGANDFFLPPSMWASNGTFFNQSEPKEGMYGKIRKGTVVPVDEDNAVVKSQAGIAKGPKIRTCTVNSDIEEIQVKVPLPTGTVLTNIADVEFQPEDVGNALQFLEFCRSFGKVIDVKKGEGEAILRELVRKQNLRRGQNTLAVQFQIRLLSLIQIDSGIESPSLTASGNNSWLKALEDIISESDLVLKDFPLEWLEEGISGYHNLELSTKLRVLNFLCDEVLCTAKLRAYIDDQNVRFAEEKKEAKSKVAAAKEKERSLKQKMQDEVAKAIITNEAPLSIAEHDALVSKIKSEAAQAHAEVLEAKGIIPQGKQNSDAVRTEPVFSDGSGQTFWKLKSYDSEDALLLQDIKMEDATAAKPDESWLVYGPEMKGEVDKYISSRTARPTRIRKVTTPVSPNESIEANMLNASEEQEAKE